MSNGLIMKLSPERMKDEKIGIEKDVRSATGVTQAVGILESRFHVYKTANFDKQNLKELEQYAYDALKKKYSGNDAIVRMFRTSHGLKL